jgi:hypothetical protein
LKFPKKLDLTKHWFRTDLVLRWFSGKELVGISLCATWLLPKFLDMKVKILRSLRMGFLNLNI